MSDVGLLAFRVADLVANREVALSEGSVTELRIETDVADQPDGTFSGLTQIGGAPAPPPAGRPSGPRRRPRANAGRGRFLEKNNPVEEPAPGPEPGFSSGAGAGPGWDFTASAFTGAAAPCTRRSRGRARRTPRSPAPRRGPRSVDPVIPLPREEPLGRGGEQVRRPESSLARARDCPRVQRPSDPGPWRCGDTASERSRRLHRGLERDAPRSAPRAGDEEELPLGADVRARKPEATRRARIAGRSAAVASS